MSQVPPLPGEVKELGEPPRLPVAAPVQERQRVVAIDAVRGFAVLGILLMNIQSFSMPGAAYMNPTAYGNLEGANYWVWYFSHLLADQKFMTIFSMLFGAGIVLMTSRIEASGKGSAGIHYRRMAWLILFGILHAHLLWYGDILYFYGMCGLVAWPFRKLPATVLIPLGIVVISVASLISLAGGMSLGFWEREQMEVFNEEWQGTVEMEQQEIEAYRGDYLSQFAERSSGALLFETMMFLIWGSWRAGGLMLVGMGLYKLGVLSGRASNATYWLMIALGIIGLPIVMYGILRNESVAWEGTYALFFGSQYNYWASLLVSAGWIGAIMLLHRSGALAWLMSGLEAVGRMALTNYLLHTIICTTIFYGHGLGKFGELSRVEQLVTVVCIWSFQLIASPIWLRYFQFGPAEWLWRSLSYMRPQPFRRPHPVPGEQVVHSSTG